MSNDLSDTIQPNSDQLDAVDLLGGARTFTITKVDVKKGAEQPVTISLAEFDRPWKPGLSMRRVLLYCWGSDGDSYVGRRVRLYCDPTVVFGGSAIGGTRIEAMSDIKGQQKIPLLVSRGKAATYIVQPLTDTPPPRPTTDPHARIIAAFDRLGVNVALLERKLGRDRGDWTADDAKTLWALGKKIQDGETSVEAEFAANGGES